MKRNSTVRKAARTARTGATHSGEVLAGREDAQAERQQDPAAQEAVAIQVLLQLLADLTVDLVSEGGTGFTVGRKIEKT